MSLAKLKRLAHSFPGEMGIYAKNLLTGAEVAVNADTPFYLASISKVPIMVGAVDLMNHPNRLNDLHEIEVYDYREEGKRFRYHHIGTSQTYRELLRRMISNSDTTATDMVVRIAGQVKLNQKLAGLGIDGLGEVTSIGELDRIVMGIRNARWAAVPPHAMEPHSRDGNNQFLVPYHFGVIPNPDDSREAAYRDYYRTGLNSATPRAMGRLAEGLAEESLLNKGWKNDILKDEIFSAGGEGWIGGAVPSVRQVDTKGGGKHRVKCELAVAYKGSVPEAVIGVFTQRLGLPRGDVGPLIREAANLSYKAIGLSHTIPSPTLSAEGLVFTHPKAGQIYEPGVKPPIRWKSKDITGRLTLQLVRTPYDAGDEQVIKTISGNVIDDGEWHSYTVPNDIGPGANYRFKLTSNDDSSISTYSNYFALRGVIRVIEPHLGQTIARGKSPKIRWATRGVSGRLTIELFQGAVKRRTISSVAIDDGEWHSWTVANNRQEDDNYRIRITSNDDPTVVGWSPFFTVGGRITVTSPKPGQILDIGEKPSIRWKTEDVGGNVTVKLFRGEDDDERVISSNAINDGEWHSWTVPAVLADDQGYRFEVARKADSDIKGSSHYVQIGARLEWLTPSIEQKPFNGDPHARQQYFPYGSTPRLRWRTVGELDGNLKLQLLRNGSLVKTISNNAINDGEWHSWTVSNNLNPSSNYQFRITSKVRGQVSALSQPFHLGSLVDIALPHDDALDPKTAIRIGDEPRILWRTDNITGRVRIELFRKTTRKATIASNAINDGEWHSWEVPDDIDTGRGYRFKLISKDTPQVSAFSPWFEIKA